MSGGKFALPVMAVGLLAQMMMAQQAAGAVAGAMRGEAEDEERRKRLEELRLRFSFEMREAERLISEPNALHSTHRTRLQLSYDKIMDAVQNARSEKDLWHAAGEIPHLLAEIKTARLNQRFHAAREAGQEANNMELRLKALDTGLAQIGTAEMAALDPAGNEAAHRAVDRAKTAVAGVAGDSEELIQIAMEAIEMHGRRGAERQAERMEKVAHYERAATELRAMIAGLRRDPMVCKWQAVALEDLAQLVEDSPVSEETPFLMEKVRERAAAMVEAASQAQLKADTRDYVTNSIAKSLGDMGFVVSETMEEYPEHPATAKVFQASSASGKSVLVSVPVEGEVWYEVDGYTKTTEASLGGEVILDCDEGEQVLEEMHARLEAEFEVGMSEIWWEGKDPNRNLRRAEQLPTTAGSMQGTAR